MEPGNFAAPYDRGATVDADSYALAPVTLVEPNEMVDRGAARQALGLPPDGPLALISLGAGNINDTSKDLGAAIAALRQLGVGVCVTVPQIAAGRDRSNARLHLVSDYPLSRNYRAFDLAISASGYNSFHELLRLGVPTLFVPNTSTQLDDQEARAKFAADRGWAHQLETLTVESTTALVGDLLERGREMVALAQSSDPGN